MILTVDDIAEILDVNRKAADGLVKFLLDCDPPLATFKGERPNPSGRGKGAHVYEIAPRAPSRVMSELCKLVG